MPEQENTIGSRFSDVLLRLKIDRKIRKEGEIATATGYKPSTISEIKGDRQDVSEKILNYLKDTFSVNPDYITLNRGTIYIGESKSSQDYNRPYREELREKKTANNIFFVPLVPVKAQAGYVTGYNTQEFIESLDTYPIAPGIDPRGAVWRWFEIDGDSMEPNFYAGDYILCSMVSPEDWVNIEHGLVYVILTEEKLMIKRILKKKGDPKTWVLASDNTHYKQIPVKIEEVKEVWKFRRNLNARVPPPVMQNVEI